MILFGLLRSSAIIQAIVLSLNKNIEFPFKSSEGPPEISYSTADGSSIQSSRFKVKKREYRTLIKAHYLRNTLFFYVGCLCSIIVGSYVSCIVLILSVFALKVTEIVMVYNDRLHLAYTIYMIESLINYSNIIISIILYAG